MFLQKADVYFEVVASLREHGFGLSLVFQPRSLRSWWISLQIGPVRMTLGYNGEERVAHLEYPTHEDLTEHQFPSDQWRFPPSPPQH